MKERIQFYLAVAAVIIVFDAVTSAVSRAFLMDYSNQVWVSLILYMAAGFLGHKSFDLPNGIAAGFVAALADSTIGWLLSSLIGAFFPFALPHYTPLMVFVVIVMVSLLGAFFGLLGALLFRALNRVRDRKVET